MQGDMFDELMRQHYKLAAEFRDLYSKISNQLISFNDDNKVARDWSINNTDQLINDAPVKEMTPENKEIIQSNPPCN